MAGSIAIAVKSGRRMALPTTLRSVMLVGPLLAFTIAVFILPLGLMLTQAVSTPEFSRALPQSAAVLRAPKGSGIPDAQSVATLRDELAAAYGSPALGALALAINSDFPGARSVILQTARRLASKPEGNLADALSELEAINDAWADPGFWRVLRNNAGAVTDRYLLRAVDLERDANGAITSVGDDHAIYRAAAVRTFTISLLVTLLSLFLGYPYAFLLANTSGRANTILLTCLMLPFWVSLLVRTTAWIVLLQNEGLINKTLISMGLIHNPIALIYNRTGVIIAMAHVLMPFMVLPLISVMRSVKQDLLRASAACGARPMQTFFRVYWKLTLPGIAAGSVLVFIQAVGYYITPALIGGPDDQMLGYFVALHTNETLNWSMAAAIASILLLAILALYVVFNKIAPIEQGLT